MPGENVDMVVFADDGADPQAAAALAAHLGVPLVGLLPDEDSGGLVLRMDAEGLALERGGQTLRGDFARLLPRLRPGRLQQELLVRAARLKGAGPMPTAVDATAGLGEDALLLAAAGFSVRLYERDPVIAALLRDTLRRAAAMPELADVVGRMEAFEEDSRAALGRLPELPDVVLLDPMFPARRKSALTGKKLQMIRCLERPCADEDALLEAACAARPRKVVVKRPLKGAYLAGRKPDYSIAGKTVRYDCLVCRGAAQGRERAGAGAPSREGAAGGSPTAPSSIDQA